MIEALPVVAVILGCALLVFGVFVLAGLGLSLIVAGVCLVAGGLFADVSE